MNSCNPVFISIGQKLGVEKYYSYLKKFGFLKKTNIDLPGEGTSIFLAENKVGPVELATISFGQRFKITPIQMVTAISTIANGGTYVKPHIVKQVVETETGKVRNVEIEKGEQVISKQTASKVLSMMESVVADGTGRNGQISGYSVGGKTGTSEDGVNTNRYIASFVGVTPVSNPQLVILVVLNNPTGEGGHGGGGVATPVAAKILNEVLPYLEVAKDRIKEEDVKSNVEVPNLIGMTYEEAKKLLEQNGLQITYKNELNESQNKNDKSVGEKIVINQIPISGVQLLEGRNNYYRIIILCFEHNLTNKKDNN